MGHDFRVVSVKIIALAAALLSGAVNAAQYFSYQLAFTVAAGVPTQLTQPAAGPSTAMFVQNPSKGDVLMAYGATSSAAAASCAFPIGSAAVTNSIWIPSASGFAVALPAASWVCLIGTGAGFLYVTTWANQ